ncbi:MAG: hypothetical protein RTU30_02645 [Candidatus Thorarchaeota archaeon]
MMVNKEKALKREIVSLRNLQNRGQTSSRRTRRLREARTEYWKLKKKVGVRVGEEKPKDEVKKKKPSKESKKKPEAEIEEIEEVVDEESDDEELDLDDISLEDLYDDKEDVEE